MADLTKIGSYESPSYECVAQKHTSCEITSPGVEGRRPRVCNCPCHDSLRSNAIAYLVMLRDCAPSTPGDGGWNTLRYGLEGMCGDDWPNHLIDAVGDALTFLGYPNGGQ